VSHPPAGLAARFWPKVRCFPGECWVWTAADNGAGYGVIGDKDRIVYAHRYAYETLIGPIPTGKELDHRCRNPRCVNPTHLEAVTHRENIARGVAPWARYQRGEPCIRGHARTPATTNRQGQCRPCLAELARGYRAAKAQERRA